MKNWLLFLAICCIGARLQAQRVKYNFNTDWKLITGDDSACIDPGYNDQKWKQVTLPHAWNEDDAFKKDIADLSTGIAWYRKKFSVPDRFPQQKVFIEFEGARQAAQVYINGQYAGMHENGVTAFGFDITPFLIRGKTNTIAVRTDNSWEYREKASNTKFQWIDKNFNANYGGLCKNVYLHITGPVYQTLPLYKSLGTTGTYIYPSSINISQHKATINVETQVRNESGTEQTLQLKVIVTDPKGKAALLMLSEPASLAPGDTKIIHTSATAANLQFWSWGYGYLYTVESSLLVNGKTVDVVTAQTGFRKTAFKDGMTYLNDRVIQVHGYAQRTSNEWPAIGMSVPAWLSDYSNKLIVQSNGNLVRWMHITPWKQDIESCDRVGLMQAMPAGDAEKDVEGVRWEQRKSVMRDAIVYNRNNPSIIFYECGNENISEAHMREMKAIRDSFDINGGRAIGSREMLDSKESEYGGEMLYINKSAKQPVWAMEYSRDEGLRKYWDDYSPPYHKDGDGPLYKNAPANEYNRNQESHAIENVVRWYEYWKERPGTGKRVSSGGVNIIFSETNTHHRGAENYRRSGEVDALRLPKENFYAHQVMWNGWVDVEKEGIHIIGHWNYTNNTKKTIYVVSTAEKVELFVNNRSLGFGQQSNHFLFSFPDVQWQSGKIRAVGYSANGQPTCEQTKKTSGPAYAIRLKSFTHPKGAQANGHDLILAEVEVVDKEGNRCPLAMDTIHFALTGAAEWRGGMAQGPENFILSKDLLVECGVNRVLIRTSTKAGPIKLTAVATGLKGSSLQWQSVAVPVKNGLSTLLPSYGLSGDLQRGPTPATPSFKISRIPVGIINATAGSHADSAFASYDDNEMTDWYNNGKMGTAWIEYELEKTSTVTEVNLKLNNFRTKSYPIRILVDGQEIYRGNTAKSLGYFLAICKPATGKKLRIELINAAEVVTDNGTEISGKKPDDGVTRNDAGTRDRLSIIEVEIYSSK
jgi:beta-galactosidase